MTFQVLPMLIFGMVVLALAIRGMSGEERARSGKFLLACLVFVKNAIAKPPAGGEPFYAALKTRTRWTLVTPAIVFIQLSIFTMSLAQGDLGDPRTLLGWGASIGPRTTNGEWWRLGTAMFVHAGMIHLLAEVAGIVQIGLIVERLVGTLAFAVVFVAAGVLANAWTLTVHPVSVQTGAAGAIFGVYGLLLASLVLGLLQRSAFAVPLSVLKGLWPGATVFLAYNMLAEGAFNPAMKAGLIAGFTAGMVVAARVISDKPPARRVGAVLAATAAIIVAVAAPLRGIADVSGEVARVREAEERTSRTYDTAVDRFKNGRITVEELASLADGIVSELRATQSELASLDNIPAEHWAMLERTSQYLKLRQESWRLRAEGLREGRTRTLQQADTAGQSALAALERATEPVQQ